MAVVEQRLAYTAVCTDAGATKDGVLHCLGPRFQNEVIARLWLRDAVGEVRRTGHATVGMSHHEINSLTAGAAGRVSPCQGTPHPNQSPAFSKSVGDCVSRTCACGRNLGRVAAVCGV